MTQRKTGTAITAGATSPGTLYTSAADSNDSIIILGYADYASGLGTAGTYATAPTTLQSFVVGVPGPGEVVQTIAPAPITTTTSCQTTQTQTTITAAISLQGPNLVRLHAGVAGVIGSGHNISLRFSRGAGPTLFGAAPLLSIASGAFTFFTFFEAMDAPPSGGTLTYYVYCASDVNSAATAGGSNGSSLIIEEIMGMLEPTNDNELSLTKVG
jgi:hypothetical protein